MASLPAPLAQDDEKLDIASVSAPGTLGAIDQSDAILHVEVRQALGLVNKRLFGAQDVSYEIKGMKQAVQKSRTLEDCGADAVFHDKYTFPWKGLTAMASVLEFAFWKEDGLRELLGSVKLNALAYEHTAASSVPGLVGAKPKVISLRTQWERLSITVPIRGDGGRGDLYLNVYTADPAHDAEVAALQSAAEAAAAAKKRAEAERLKAEADAKERAAFEAIRAAHHAAAQKEEAERAAAAAAKAVEVERLAQEMEKLRLAEAAAIAAAALDQSNAKAAAAAAAAAKKRADAQAKRDAELAAIKANVIAGKAVNQDGAVATGHVDDSRTHITFQKFTYYCGRMVGQAGYHNACGTCDGGCGPTNGCQCKACNRLSCGERLNADGVVATARKNAKGGCASGEVLHYCGRAAGQHGGYVKACGACAGACGAGGCQCTGCYAIDYDPKTGARRQRLLMNSDGAIATRHVQDDRGHRKTFNQPLAYCGRKVGNKGYWDPCGSCDGRCGPTNGCQCKACHSLDFD